MSSNLGFIHRFQPGQVAGPTLLLLHGTGGDENDLIPLAQLLAPDTAILSPRGKVLENGMPRFFRRLAEGVFDVDDLQRRTHELVDFVTAAADEYGFNAERVIAVGFSNGANIAAAMLLLRPSVMQAAILFHAMVPLEPERMPNLHETPVFLGAGEFDPVIPPDNTRHLDAMLRQAGARVTMHWEPTGHTLTRAEIRAAAAWLAETDLLAPTANGTPAE
ncbi:MAG: alpha/beta hydrolase [Chloroflexota bacterium]